MKDKAHVSYRTGELDLMYAEEGIWVALGPNFADDAELVNAFNRIAKDGPQNRVGLLPSRTTRRWRFVREPGKNSVLPPCPVACTSIEQVMANATKVRPEVPVAAWRCGDYLCIYCDHGLGDGSYIARVVAALTNPVALASFGSGAVGITRHPFALALWTGLRSQPRQVISDGAKLGHAVAVRLRAFVRTSQHMGRATDAVLPVRPDTSDVRTVWVSSAPGFLKELRAYRDAAHPSISITALLMFAIRMCIESAVEEMSGNIEVLIDMRRFLPKDSTTNANFASVVAVPLSQSDTPEAFSSALNSNVISYVPLIKLLAAAAISKFRYSLSRNRRRPRFWEQPQLSLDRRTKLTFIDWAKFPANFQLHWPDLSRAELAAVTPPVSNEHITIVLTSPGENRVQVTARFHESHVDSEAVRSALEQALTPAYLARAEGPQR